jgi:putative transposase
VENLNVKGMQRNHHLASSVSDASISEFMRMLEYKCEWQGVRLVKIGRFDPSSQLCHVCGHRYSGLRLSEREWTCPSCGTHHDRDLNAAINIKNFGLGLNEALPSVRGKVKPAKQPPVDGRCPVQPKKQCCAKAGKAKVHRDPKPRSL